MITAKIEHVSKDEEANGRLWVEIVDLLADYWAKRGADVFDEDSNLAVDDLIQGWFGKTIVVSIARDEDGKPVGLALAIQFRHIFYASNLMVVEVIHANEQEGYNALVDSLKTYSEVSGVDDLYFSIPKRDQDLPNILVQAGVEMLPADDITQRKVKI